MFILRHLQHAARQLKPHGSPRLHAAFIDFKQAYDTIPRCKLWLHLQQISMPTTLLNVVRDMYDNDSYILVDGPKSASVHPNRGVKQGCPLSPLLFSLYINDIGEIAEGVHGAVTGTEGVRVTHALYADDLTLVSNSIPQVQRMLDRLAVYARKKSLIVNVAKSEVVHFNSRSAMIPELRFEQAVLACRDSFKYLGMLFTKELNMRKAADLAVQPFMAATHRVREFLHTHSLTSRPHTALWLAKTYVIPAGMYGSQVWGTQYLRSGQEFKSTVQKCHLGLLKSILGIKRSAPTWAVLRECGHEPLQFYWFRATVKFYNSMLNSNSNLLRQVLKADCALRMRDQKCWTAEFLSGLHSLQHGDVFRNAVIQGQKLCMQQVVTQLRCRQQAIWISVDGLDPRVVHEHSKLAAYHNWFALPLSDTQSALLPRYLHMDLPKHVTRATSRFRLRAHDFKVETAHYNNTSSVCDQCACLEIQDEKHMLFYCHDARVCALRTKYASLFSSLFSRLQHFSMTVDPFLRTFHHVSNQDVSDFLEQHSNKLFFFLFELMHVFMLAGSNQQAEQPN